MKKIILFSMLFLLIPDIYSKEHDQKKTIAPFQIAINAMGEEFQSSKELSKVYISQELSQPESPTSAIVTIIEDDLLDDSVAAKKTIFTFFFKNGQWVIVNKTTEYRCAPGRGHQEFTPELCK